MKLFSMGQFFLISLVLCTMGGCAVPVHEARPYHVVEERSYPTVIYEDPAYYSYYWGRPYYYSGWHHYHRYHR